MKILKTDVDEKLYLNDYIIPSFNSDKLDNIVRYNQITNFYSFSCNASV